MLMIRKIAMNQSPKKKIAKLFSPEYDKLWMILLPCITICCCVIILAPQVSALIGYAKTGNAPAEPAVSAGESTVLKLTASSFERDMDIVVCDGDSNVVTGVQFAISVTYPDGDTVEYRTQTDGRCYIVELSPGEYSVSMTGGDGYAAAPVKCIVNDTAVYAPVQDESSGGWKAENGRTYYYGSDGRKETGLKKIGGKLYYFNERGEKARTLGIDVSCFNGRINWNAVKAQGIEFVIIRVGGRGWSSGRVYEDTFLREYLAGARKAGLETGVYFYSTAVSAAEAVHEAGTVLEKLKGMQLEYPVYIDMEFSGDYPHGRADLLSVSERVGIADAFCRTVMRGGYAAGIYTSEYYMTYCMNYHSVSQYSYWLANYSSGAMPAFSGRYDIWQFTNSGQLAGICGTVDFNAIF